MSALCAILRDSFEAYENDALPAPQRRMLREHLMGCPECRDRASAQDPTMLFARPIREEIPEADQRQILAAVRTGVALMETERRIRRSPGRRLGGAAAAAAAVAALVLLIPGSQARHSPETSVAVASDAGPAPAAGIAATASVQKSVLDPASLPEEAEPTSSHATVYDLNPGAGRGEPRVVWIVDRGLDI